MLTKRKVLASSRPAPPNTHAFFARLETADKALLTKAQARMTLELGDKPSHPVLMGELLKAYLQSPANETANYDNKGTSALDI